MTFPSHDSLRYFDQAISSIEDLTAIKKLTDFSIKCKQAHDSGANVASLLSDESNLDLLQGSFGPQTTTVLQIITRLMLEDYYKKSFNTYKEIDDSKIDFIYKSIGGWKQFDIVIELFHEDSGEFYLIEPSSLAHWHEFDVIRQGSIVCVYVVGIDDSISDEQCFLALERIEAIFDTIQNIDRDVTSIKSNRTKTQSFQEGSEPKKISNAKKAKTKKKKTVKKAARSIRKKGFGMSTGELVKSLRFMINKQDTFIHAGNAQLIITHLRDFDGDVKFHVIRGEKEEVRLDADSIWTKEIRNGEEVLYEFYGDKEPDEEFLKDLILKTNKYTQADKF